MRRFPRSLTSGVGSVIITLLAAGFFASVIMMAFHILGAEKFDYAIVGELLLVAVLALEGIVAVSHLRQSRLDSLHVLIEVLQDFRSAEMMLALVSLWRFKAEHGDRFVEAYLQRWEQDNEVIAQLPGSEQCDAIQATLHYRRRIVKEFYNMLAGLYEMQVLPPEVIYTYWNHAELKIIPEILIPLESAVARTLRTEAELGDWFGRLHRLYSDNPNKSGHVTMGAQSLSSKAM